MTRGAMYDERVRRILENILTGAELHEEWAGIVEEWTLQRAV